MKAWYRSNEITEIPGMPSTIQGVNLKAKTEKWEKRKAIGVKGRAIEYHIDSLPSDAKRYLVDQYADNMDDDGIDDVAIKERVKKLIGNRTIENMVEDWGVDALSLTNYLYKEEALDADTAHKIVNNERVTLDWLLRGEQDGVKQNTQVKIKERDNGLDAKQNKLKKLLAISDDKLTQLIDRIEADGINSVLIDRKVLQIARMVSELPDEALKEILLLINRAQYCALVGIPFHVTDQDITNCKKRA